MAENEDKSLHNLRSSSSTFHTLFIIRKYYILLLPTSISICYGTLAKIVSYETQQLDS